MFIFKIFYHPLHDAIKFGRIEILKILLSSNRFYINEIGAEHIFFQLFYCTPLMLAVKRGRTQMVKLLLENHANVNRMKEVSSNFFINVVSQNFNIL